MKLHEALDRGMAPQYDPQDAPIRKAKRIWSQISDLLVDLEDEMLDARKRYPEDEGVERAMYYLNNNELEEFVKELRTISDK